MSFLRKLLRPAHTESPAPKSDEPAEAESPAPEAPSEPETRPVWQPAEEAQQQERSAFDDLKEQAESALREAVEQVQSVVSRARNHVDQIQRYQEQARAAVDQHSMPPDAAPASTSPEATVMTSPDRQVITEASAGMLMEYLRHVFDLVSMENRLIEKRLDSLQESLDRLDRRLSSQAAEVSNRFDALDAVQLPLVRGQSVSNETVATPEVSSTHQLPPSEQPTEVGAEPAPGEPANTEAAGAEPGLALPGEALLEDSAAVSAAVPPEAIPIPDDETTWAAGELSTPYSLEENREADGELVPELEAFTEHDALADSGLPTSGGEGPAKETDLQPTAPLSDSAVADSDYPTRGGAVTDSGSEAGEQSEGPESDLDEPYDGPPVEGTLAIAGLATFRMLAAVRDALQNSGYVLAVEPLRFEAGDAQLRVRATRPLKTAEIQGWLANATGAAIENVGDMSYRVVGARSVR